MLHERPLVTIGRVIRSVEPHASARQLYDFEIGFEYVS